MTKSNRGLAVVIMAVILFATIFMIPVPAASAGSAGSAAGSAAAVKPNAAGRYILGATVSQQNLLHTMNSKWIYRDVLYCFFDDENGDTWVYSYEPDSEIPPVNQSVTLIMNCNGTPDDNFDDIIEDILWCNCESAAVESAAN